MKNLEQQIIEFLERNHNCDLKRIKKGLRLNDDVAEITLEKLEEKGIIYLNKNGTYSLSKNKTSLCIGKAHFLASGDVLVTDLENNHVIIPKEDSIGIFEKDIISANKIKVDKKGNIYGTLDKILKRKTNQITCEVVFENGKNRLIPYNSKNKNYICIDEKKLSKYGVGEILLISLNKNVKNYNGEIIKSIGHINDPDVDEKSIAYDFGFEVDFSKKALKELEKIPTKVIADDYIKEGRKDLRNLNVFTIDGKDTKDIDDSIAIEVLSNGNYKLYVNIADVSHYVKENSSLDNDAYQRATSVYMNDTAIPMLPPKISNGICSLHPNVDRLTKTSEMIIDKKGNIVDYDLYDSVINSKKKMNYDDVNKILIDNIIPEGYEPFVEDLKIMHELSKTLEKGKIARGYVNFNRSEIKAKGKGQLITFDEKNQRDGEKLIENFMLAANETVAQHIYYRGLPFIYRVHETPDEEKIESFIEILEELGYNFKKCKSITSNKYIQNIAEQINNDKENASTLSELLLINTMKKAKYSNLNIGHFGLALPHYTHFTSPIRRYADLTVHRLLDTYKGYDKFNYNELDKMLEDISNQCTKRSNAADKAEIEARQMRIAEYMENNIGKSFNATVISINSSALKVKTDEGFYGHIMIEDFIHEGYKYDVGKNWLINKTTDEKITIGTKLEVTVYEASKKLRTVKFTTSKIYKKSIDKIKVKKKKH